MPRSYVAKNRSSIKSPAALPEFLLFSYATTSIAPDFFGRVGRSRRCAFVHRRREWTAVRLADAGVMPSFDPRAGRRARVARLPAGTQQEVRSIYEARVPCLLLGDDNRS